MIGHPGKKFFLWVRFWSVGRMCEERGIDWHLMEHGFHQELNNYAEKLFHLYSEEEVLYRYDDCDMKVFCGLMRTIVTEVFLVY
jgi:1,4-alpha-glucan branching enzyme